MTQCPSTVEWVNCSIFPQRSNKNEQTIVLSNTMDQPDKCKPAIWFHYIKFLQVKLILAVTSQDSDYPRRWWDNDWGWGCRWCSDSDLGACHTNVFLLWKYIYLCIYDTCILLEICCYLIQSLLKMHETIFSLNKLNSNSTVFNI